MSAFASLAALTGDNPLKEFGVGPIVYTEYVNGSGDTTKQVKLSLDRQSGDGTTAHVFLQQSQQQCNDGSIKDTYTYGSMSSIINDASHPDVYPMIERDAQYVHTIPELLHVLRMQKSPMPCGKYLIYCILNPKGSNVYTIRRNRSLVLLDDADKAAWAASRAREMLDSIASAVDAQNKDTIKERAQLALNRAIKNVSNTGKNVAKAVSKKAKAELAVQRLTERLKAITVAEAAGTLADAEIAADPEEYDYFSDNDSA
jgi:hypothetical protein